MDITPSCEKSIKKACKKNLVLRKILHKKMQEIVSNPLHYKPLKHSLSGERRVHILKSFILRFKVNKDNNTVTFLDFSHHDNAYNI